MADRQEEREEIAFQMIDLLWMKLKESFDDAAPLETNEEALMVTKCMLECLERSKQMFQELG